MLLKLQIMLLAFVQTVAKSTPVPEPSLLHVAGLVPLISMAHMIAWQWLWVMVVVIQNLWTLLVIFWEVLVS